MLDKVDKALVILQSGLVVKANRILILLPQSVQGCTAANEGQHNFQRLDGSDVSAGFFQHQTALQLLSAVGSRQHNRQLRLLLAVIAAQLGIAHTMLVQNCEAAVRTNLLHQRFQLVRVSALL